MPKFSPFIRTLVKLNQGLILLHPVWSHCNYLHLQWSYLQVRFHSEQPGVSTSIHEFWGTMIQTKRPRKLLSILFHSNEFKWPHMASSYCTGQHRPPNSFLSLYSFAKGLLRPRHRVKLCARKVLTTSYPRRNPKFRERKYVYFVQYPTASKSRPEWVRGDFQSKAHALSWSSSCIHYSVTSESVLGQARVPWMTTFLAAACGKTIHHSDINC